MPSLTEQTKPQPGGGPGPLYMIHVHDFTGDPQEDLGTFGSISEVREALCGWVLSAAGSLLADTSSKRIIETAEEVVSMHGPALRRCEGFNVGLLRPKFNDQSTYTATVKLWSDMEFVIEVNL